MPKRTLYTRESIINTSIAIIRSEGTDALTARSISKRLGCSVAPIFWTFNNMEELLGEVRKTAQNLFRDYVSDSVRYQPAFKEFGLRLIRFSREETNLFHYIFLDMGSDTGFIYDIVSGTLRQNEKHFNISPEQSLIIFKHIWPFACGLAVLCNKNPAVYNDETVSEMLSAQFQALITMTRNGAEVENVTPRVADELNNKRLNFMKVSIRPWRREDAPALAESLSNKKVQANLRDGLPYPYTEKDALEYIDSMLAADPSGTFAFAIEVDGKVAGSIGAFRQGNIHRRTAEVGYYVGEPYWGRGIMTEALKQLCEYVFANTDIIRLFAEPFAYNIGSRRVLEKNAFKMEGILRSNAVKGGKVLDMVMYSLIKE